MIGGRRKSYSASWTTGRQKWWNSHISTCGPADPRPGQPPERRPRAVGICRQPAGRVILAGLEEARGLDASGQGFPHDVRAGVHPHSPRPALAAVSTLTWKGCATARSSPFFPHWITNLNLSNVYFLGLIHVVQALAEVDPLPQQLHELGDQVHHRLITPANIRFSTSKPRSQRPRRAPTTSPPLPRAKPTPTASRRRRRQLSRENSPRGTDIDARRRPHVEQERFRTSRASARGSASPAASPSYHLQFGARARPRPRSPRPSRPGGRRGRRPRPSSPRTRRRRPPSRRPGPHRQESFFLTVLSAADRPSSSSGPTASAGLMMSLTTASGATAAPALRARPWTPPRLQNAARRRRPGCPPPAARPWVHRDRGR